MPVAYRCHVILSKMWSNKDRQAYDKLVKGQRKDRHRGQRRENPVLVACPHRLCFAFSNDGAVALEARHLAMVCAGENFSDWAGEDGLKFGGSLGKADYALRPGELIQGKTSSGQGLVFLSQFEPLKLKPKQRKIKTTRVDLSHCRCEWACNAWKNVES